MRKIELRCSRHLEGRAFRHAELPHFKPIFTIPEKGKEPVQGQNDKSKQEITIGIIRPRSRVLVGAARSRGR